jgi:hypothetical protein
MERFLGFTCIDQGAAVAEALRTSKSFFKDPALISFDR